MVFEADQIKLGLFPLCDGLSFPFPVQKGPIVEERLSRFPGGAFNGISRPLDQVHGLIILSPFCQNGLDFIFRFLLTGHGGGDRDVIVVHVAHFHTSHCA